MCVVVWYCVLKRRLFINCNTRVSIVLLTNLEILISALFFTNHESCDNAVCYFRSLRESSDQRRRIRFICSRNRNFFSELIT